MNFLQKRCQVNLEFPNRRFPSYHRAAFLLPCLHFFELSLKSLFLQSFCNIFKFSSSVITPISEHRKTQVKLENFEIFSGDINYINISMCFKTSAITKLSLLLLRHNFFLSRIIKNKMSFKLLYLQLMSHLVSIFEYLLCHLAYKMLPHDQ